MWVYVISESGLYKLGMRSNKPDAVKFQDWIASVVLPTNGCGWSGSRFQDEFRPLDWGRTAPVSELVLLNCSLPPTVGQFNLHVLVVRVDQGETAHTGASTDEAGNNDVHRRHNRCVVEIWCNDRDRHGD